MTDQSPTGITRQRYPLKARTLSVIRVEQLSPDMRRIVLGGEELEASLPYPRMGVADHVKLVIPDEATGEVVLPQLGERGVVRPEGVDLVLRQYTIRRFDAVARELSLDFVLHEHGPAGRWAIAAKPGDRIGVLGPRGSTIQPDGHSRYVIGADETALPATERWIEEAPEGAELEVFALVEDASRERALPSHPGLRLHWLHRASGGDLASALIRAVPADDGAAAVWAAAEATSLQPLRRHLRELGLPRERMELHGYWKLGEADHHEPHGTEGRRGGERRPERARRPGPAAGEGAGPGAPGIPANRLHLLEEPSYGVLAVGKPDGSIIATPMWFAHRDGRILFTHTTRRGKFRALRTNPHMTLTVLSPSSPNEYLELRGVLEEVEPDSEGRFFATLAERYGRGDGAPPSDVEHRVVLVMRIEQAHSGERMARGAVR